MSEPEVLTQVPDQLKRLVRLIARAFYRVEHIVVLDVLVKYPCVTESDLMELLKLQGSIKQLRQTLTFLKRDQLVKTLQKMESDGVRGQPESGQEGAEKQHMRLVNYWYINYKQFVNTVKYKLDQMRKKIELEEKRVQNRTSYLCSRCPKTFSELDVDRLFDPADGILKCSHCGTVLVEEAQQEAKSSAAPKPISWLNAQISPILALLKEVENVNLAPYILEPEAQSIHKHLLARGLRLSTSGVKKTDEIHNWSTKQAYDIYGGGQTVSVDIGASNAPSEPVLKEQPVWMERSTVYSEDTKEDHTLSTSTGDLEQQATARIGVPERQIMADILTHEMKPKVPLGGASFGTGPSPALETAQYSSSSSDDEGVMEAVGGDVWVGESESEEEEEFTVKVGEELVALDDVTDDMVSKMTEEERRVYTEMCQRAYSDIY